ncbi:MAG: RNA polymerase sigma factor [Devosia sp.]|nr:RNA polymerase sigma factor [Devosia sp.]
MSEPVDWAGRVAAVYREDRLRVLASLIRLLGDFDAAEEAVHDAFAAAVEQWPQRGMPESPWRWLVSAGRFKAIDRIRRRARADASRLELLRRLEAAADEAKMDDETLEDDALRLIFTCCHPALPPDAQIALTLREVCGLTTEAIAGAFLTAAPTVAQRIVRAKTRIREMGLPYEVPSRSELPERLEAVLRVIYLVFNEGYSSSTAGPGLTDEAIRLGRRLVGLLPDPEAFGLLALILLHDSRKAARTCEGGELVLLPDQDRNLWDSAKIAEATGLLDPVLGGREYGTYTLQAAIAAEHARATTESDTNWGRIVEFYDLLGVADPSPVVELNRAAAIAMRDGPAAGIELMDAILSRGDLTRYHFAYAARAELQCRLGDKDAARADYREALALVRQQQERRFIGRRLAQLDGDG